MWSRTVSIAKEGLEWTENEDRTAAAAHRFALADGVSRSARSEVWAQLLVDAFVVDCVDPLDPDILASLQVRWKQLVDEPGLEWWALAKLAECGGAATFVGLTVDVHSERLHVRAVGDSCFFHLRGDALLTAGPLTDWHMFDVRTVAVPTTPEDQDFRTAVWELTSPYRSDDILMLASDALAQHLLQYPDQREELSGIAEKSSYQADFAGWVQRERRAGRLHDDDTTLCVVFT